MRLIGLPWSFRGYCWDVPLVGSWFLDLNWRDIAFKDRLLTYVVVCFGLPMVGYEVYLDGLVFGLFLLACVAGFWVSCRLYLASLMLNVVSRALGPRDDFGPFGFSDKDADELRPNQDSEIDSLIELRAYLRDEADFLARYIDIPWSIRLDRVRDILLEYVSQPRVQNHWRKRFNYNARIVKLRKAVLAKGRVA